MNKARVVPNTTESIKPTSSWVQNHSIADHWIAQEGRFDDYYSGKSWKEIKKNYEEKDVIAIFLYNDDFGLDDGLIPHGPSNKVSGYYYR